MIDHVVFLREMALLSERFNRQNISEPVMQRYYEILSANLSTQQFELAARHVFANNTFWPSPIELINAAKGTVEDNAALEWLGLMTALVDNKPHDLSQTGREALKAIGGKWVLEHSTNHTGLRRDFIAAFEALERKARSTSTELATL